jgi:uncharacterized iron-regulated membrane protein
VSFARAAQRRSLFWRIHFWAALIASPFTLLAVLTGALYIFTPQIEAQLYGHLERVTPAGARLPLDATVAAARAVAPAGFAVQAVVAPGAPDAAVRVTFAPALADTGEHAAHGQPAPAPASPFAPVAGKMSVYVDPYRAQVLGTLCDDDRFSDWARRLHSRLLQGNGWRWMIELAASWLLVMLLTGVYLWWPRAGLAAGLPRAGTRGRTRWRRWHGFLGVLLAVLSLAMVLTGITWSRYGGAQVRMLRDAAGQAGAQPPAHLHSMPQARPQLDYQQAWDRTCALRGAASGACGAQLTPPRGPHGVWRAGAADLRHPMARFDLVLNAYDGQVLYAADWRQQTAFGKATAVGIPFHRGELGVWNQVLLLVFAAGILFSLLSGWVMFFKRRRAGGPGLPPLLPGAWRAAPPAAVVIGVALCALLPLLALSAGVVIAIEARMARGT